MTVQQLKDALSRIPGEATISFVDRYNEDVLEVDDFQYFSADKEVWLLGGEKIEEGDEIEEIREEAERPFSPIQEAMRNAAVLAAANTESKTKKRKKSKGAANIIDANFKVLVDETEKYGRPAGSSPKEKPDDKG